jgi:predicted transposase/invertase (TIGR01784 family)
MNETLYQTVLKDLGLTQFTKNYDYVTADDELRNEYNNYVQDVWYVNGIIRCATEEGMEKGVVIGREEGMEKGISQAKLETAHEMLRDNLPSEKIAKYTGLPLETIRTLTP